MRCSRWPRLHISHSRDHILFTTPAYHSWRRLQVGLNFGRQLQAGLSFKFEKLILYRTITPSLNRGVGPGPAGWNTPHMIRSQSRAARRAARSCSNSRWPSSRRRVLRWASASAVSMRRAPISSAAACSRRRLTLLAVIPVGTLGTLPSPIQPAVLTAVAPLMKLLGALAQRHLHAGLNGLALTRKPAPGCAERPPVSCSASVIGKPPPPYEPTRTGESPVQLAGSQLR